MGRPKRLGEGTVNVGFRVSRAFKEALEAEARADCRTMSQLVTKVMTDYLVARGRLQVEGPREPARREPGADP